MSSGFVGFISVFNISGRLLWAAASDRIGRKLTFFVFFTFGMLLYAVVAFPLLVAFPSSFSVL